MIELLYIDRNANYIRDFILDIGNRKERHGDIVLNPISANLHMEYAGTYELTVQCCIDDYIKNGKKVFDNNSIVKTNALQVLYRTVSGDWSKTSGVQLFSIYSIEVNNYEVTFHAEPIMNRLLRQKYAIDVRPENMATYNGLLYLQENSFGEMPIQRIDPSGSGTGTKTAYYQNMNLLEATNGTQDNSMVNRWEVLIIPDNNFCCFVPMVVDQQTRPTAWTFAYGKDLTGLQVQYDMSAVVKWVRPVGYNGKAMSLNYANTNVQNGGVWAANTDRVLFSPKKEMVFDYIKMREDVSEGEDIGGLVICDNQSQLDNALYNAVQDMYNNKNIDKPRVAVDITVVDLSKNSEVPLGIRKIIKSEIYLGDKVRVYSAPHGVDIATRVIAVDYNCLTGETEKITLSNSEYDYFKLVNMSVNTSANIYKGRL